MMEMCKECVHREVCYIRAINLLQNENRIPAMDITFCEDYLAKAEKVDIYKMADRITETVKQVVLANLRTICDEEGD